MSAAAPKRIALLTVTGLGDTLLFLPALRALRRAWPEARIDALCASRSAREFFEMCEEVDGIHLVGDTRDRSLGAALTLLRRAWTLRRERYDLSLTVFPANRAAAAVLAWLVGARRRAVHRYDGRSQLLKLHWLNHGIAPADPSLHDVEQDLALAAAAGAPGSADGDALRLRIPAAAAAAAETSFEEWGLSAQRVTGMHVTSYADMTYKRWRAERFGELIGRIVADPTDSVILFGTEGERPYLEAIAGNHPERVHVASGFPFAETAALVARCARFVSNDSGLMHVAVCCAVPTLGIFGPTNVTRTAPYGEMHAVVRPDDCPGCYAYPFGSDPRLKQCQRTSCLERLDVDRVWNALAALPARAAEGSA